MIVTAHQPAYLPWAGYLEKINQSDIYVYLDDVQFEKRSYISRNQIKTPSGTQWLSIPVHSKGHRHTTILNTEINPVAIWGQKHLQAIRLNYARAPFFKSRFAKLEEHYHQLGSENNLAEFGFKHLKFWIHQLNISTRIVRMSELDLRSSKAELIYDICQCLNASCYIAGAQGKDYLSESWFERNNVKLVHQQFVPTVYSQLWDGFIPCLSFLDHWFNVEENPFGGGL